MSCEICGRGSCTRSFHSLEAQEEFDMTPEERIEKLERENADLKALNAVNESGCDNALKRYEASAAVVKAQTEAIVDLQAKLARAQAAVLYAHEIYGIYNHAMLRHGEAIKEAEESRNG